jgi:hypothetical protein
MGESLDMGDINVVMGITLVFIATAVAFTRETPKALDMLADWAACRSYGLKCAKAEAQRRKEYA